MQISSENSEFLKAVVRDFWTPQFLNAIPEIGKDGMKRAIEKGKVETVIQMIPEWYLFRFLHEKGYTFKLVTRKKQLWVKDRYGDADPDPWCSELRQFIEKRINNFESVFSQIPNYCLEASLRLSCEHLLKHNDESFLFMAIDNHVENWTWQEEDENEDAKIFQPTDGYEFERYVAQILQANAWEVRHIGKTGDQGADLIAEKGGYSFAIQCKFVSYPVGNSAVQEAHAGRGFHRTKFAAVVTNADFTRSAKQLANSVGVDLLNLHDLKNF